MRCMVFFIIVLVLSPVVISTTILPPPPAVGTKSTACEDLVLTDGETDIDCGGRCSFIGKLCGEGQNCQANSDCTSNICVGEICGIAIAKSIEIPTGSTSSTPAASRSGSGGGGGGGAYVSKKKAMKKNVDTCQDKILSESETDIDCGGSCPSCTVGSQCKDNNDCLTKYCYEEVCSVYEEIIAQSTIGEDTFAKQPDSKEQTMVGSATEILAKQDSNSLLIAGLSILVGILVCIAGYFAYHHYVSQPHPKLKQYVKQSLAKGVDEMMLYNYLKERGYDPKTLLKAFEK